jgi:peptide/nickel transport system substrate-binding protein
MGVWSEDAKSFTVTLRDDVLFHDGTTLNASDVKYTFDRLNNLIAIGESQLGELYQPLAALYPDNEDVIDEVVVVSEFVVRFDLNYPYVAFVPLLCFSGSFILPQGMYPTNTLMNVTTDILVGTGPFEFTSQNSETTVLTAFDDYYLGKAQLDSIIFVLFDDAPAKNQAFLAGDLDWIDGVNPEYLAQFQADEDFVVGENRPNTASSYLGMNNKLLNKTMRQAVSYSINYDYLISGILLGNAVRQTSVVPAGIMYHIDTNVATYDLIRARDILVKAGLAKGLTTESTSAQWQALANNNPIARLNFTYNSGNSVRAQYGALIQNGLLNSGIKMEICALTWGEYLARLYDIDGGFNKLQLYLIGWGADYNDPSNFVNSLLSNTSSSNSAQVNDPTLQKMMMDALTITNTTERAAKYAELQRYVCEDLMPWAFLTNGFGKGVRRRDVQGILRNGMTKIYFYPMYFGAYVPWPAYVWPATSTPTTTPTTTAPEESGIPGYSLIALLGVAAFTATALIYKKRK